MGCRFSQQESERYFFVTTTFVDWQPFGNRPGMYQALADSLNFCLGKYDGKLIAYVFMPSHLHLVLEIDGKKLSGLMRDFKKFVAQKALKDLGIKGHQVWKGGFDRQALTSERQFRRKIEYIHANPVRAELTSTTDRWEWSSYQWYAGDRSGPLVICSDWHW